MPSVGTLRVGRYFLALLLIFVALFAVVGLGSRQTPKLGIDLAGGKRVIFDAITTKQHAKPSSDSMSQARQIIEDRVNNQGVTGSTVQVQNGNQLVVTIPGGTGTDVKELGQPAVLNFRGIMAPAQVVSCGVSAQTTTPTATPSATSGGTANSSTSASSTASASTSKSAASTRTASSGAAGNAFADRRLAAKPSTTPSVTKTRVNAKPTATPTGTATGTASGTATGATPTGSTASSSAATSTKCLADPIGALFKTDPGLKKVMPNAEKCPTPSLSSGAACRAFSDLSTTRQTELLSAISRFKCAAAQTEQDLDTRYYLACDDGTNAGVPVAYLLGHVVVPGSEVSSATALAPGSSGTQITSKWSIQVNLNGTGGGRWNAWTSKYHTDQSTANGASAIQTSATAPCGPSAAVPCSDFVGFTLNGQVVSTAINLAALDRVTQITGNFSQSSADKLAQELNFGRLPLSFKLESNESVSATLGSVQLKAAFLAGGIGLLLVVLYSLAYYRGLGLVTIASLLVSAGLTYAMLVILGTQIGFTLDLAGIAGFIVALGITADSFVVFFERIKDEVHEGRSMRVAVPRAWIRARRTILSADTVSFLAAAILYYFASADVKGFAFTLGLSTILDLVVVFLFTHPIVSLLSRSRAFGSPRFTGLNSVRTGPSIADDDTDAPRRRPARTAAASARERAAGRRGMTAAPVATVDTDAPDVGAPDEPVDDIVVEDSARYDDGTSAADELTDESTDGPVGEADRGPSGGTAAERAAARRARRRGGNSNDGEES